MGANRNKCSFGFWGALAAALILLFGCSHVPLPQEQQHWLYRVKGGDNDASRAWAPAFVVYGHHQPHNRIGRPAAELDKNGREHIFIDPEHPSAYVMERTFTTPSATYTNKIYRIHFPKVPFSLIPFNITAGKNVGVLVVVTLNDTGQPLLVTTVHTCGCYMVIVPTQYLPREAYPLDWDFEKPQKKYGERLPAVLTVDQLQQPQIVVHFRPDVHRVMRLEILEESQLNSESFQNIPLSVYPMDALNHLPLDGHSTSFFHQDGTMKGFVKGAVKPWESLLMSLISLDFFIGTDKAYADTADTENPFYTSLKPWRRQDSNMWKFEQFLAFWGWRL